MQLLTQQKSSTFLVPGATEDQSDVSLVMHRTEPPPAVTEKDRPASKPSSTSGRPFPGSFAAVLRGGTGGRGRGLWGNTAWLPSSEQGAWLGALPSWKPAALDQTSLAPFYNDAYVNM